MERSKYILTSFMSKEDVFILHKTYKKFYEYYPAEIDRSVGKSTRRYYKGSMVVFQVPSARAYKKSDDDNDKNLPSPKINKSIRRKHER